MAKNLALEATIKDIAHQLRTPLVVINAGISTVKSCLPGLIHAYKLAKEKGQVLEDIPHNKLLMLEKLLDNSQQEAHFVNDYINTLTKYLEVKPQ